MKKIPLTNGLFALVDDEDYEMLSRYRWRASYNHRDNLWYVARAGRKGEPRTVMMHRQIMAPPRDMQVDHIDHDNLDNRRSNLRIVTRSQNLANRRKKIKSRSEFKGVTWHRRDKKWQAQVQWQGKTYHLGYFDSEVDAARAYDAGARAIQGEFSKPNFSRKK